MPVSIMNKLPGHEDANGAKKKKETDYLSSVRELWFILFDRMAEFQFVGGPYMLDKKMNRTLHLLPPWTYFHGLVVIDELSRRKRPRRKLFCRLNKHLQPINLS
jgi:hypothetical protein